jgi:hypothetical protein
MTATTIEAGCQDILYSFKFFVLIFVLSRSRSSNENHSCIQMNKCKSWANACKFYDIQRMTR